MRSSRDPDIPMPVLGHLVSRAEQRMETTILLAFVSHALKFPTRKLFHCLPPIPRPIPPVRAHQFLHLRRESMTAGSLRSTSHSVAPCRGLGRRLHGHRALPPRSCTAVVVAPSPGEEETKKVMCQHLAVSHSIGAHLRIAPGPRSPSPSPAPHFATGPPSASPGDPKRMTQPTTQPTRTERRGPGGSCARVAAFGLGEGLGAWT